MVRLSDLEAMELEMLQYFASRVGVGTLDLDKNQLLKRLEFVGTD